MIQCMSPSSDGSEDELAAGSDSEFSSQHANKRRKLNTRTVIHSGSSSSSDHFARDPSSKTPSIESRQVTQVPKDSDTPQKPKSKYRIHIPKNGDIPRDDFYTQPPQRASSPYRIEPFCWQKRAIAAPIISTDSEHNREQSPSLQMQARKLNITDPAIKSRAQLGHSSSKDVLRIESRTTSAEDFHDVLADLPSDAFSSPERPSVENSNHSTAVSSQRSPSPSRKAITQLQQPLRAPQVNLRQKTLFGQQATEPMPQTQPLRRRNWPLANREEPPTHHELDESALETWVYPTNLGTVRDYQYSIVAKGLYHNLLVALPTGLGKTFIAATVMLNWFRWTTKAQIIFVAPTRPLVAQQVKACFEIAGIPRAATTMLTGNTPTGVRAEQWQNKRVFFMTPQTLINDLKSGICDPKKIVLVVVDEAHRATGNYAYVEVIKFLKRFNTSFRVLALTATPGASVETVQEVIDGLGISRIEIRTEESLDIRQYVHSRKIDTVIFDNSDEMAMIMDLFSKSLQPILDKLNGMNAYWNKDPMTLTPYGCSQARGSWMQSDAGRKANFGLKGMVNTIFTLLASLSHATELLKYHGIGPFFQKVLAFRNDTHASGDKGSKYKKQIIESEHFQKLMTRVQSWVNNPDFVGHPKLEYLQSVVMNHFLDAGDGRGATDPSRTRIMVFAHYRDSAEEIARVLSRNDPIIRPHVFVGQTNSKNSEGMDQNTQLAVIRKFQDGVYNVLVATSIGEEGLDIGQVDLIVCYDASASPIRMLQRMGRTGRKRAGNIVVTLMRGKEENNFVKAKDNYEKMQHEIAAGTRFTFHDESSRRIVPRIIQPNVERKVIDIPPENTQPELPEPSKRAKPPKRPAKKLHLPDNVRTGFVKASRIDEMNDGESGRDLNEAPVARTKSSPALIPSLQEVLLTSSEEKELERSYLDVKGDTPQIVVVPRVDTFPTLQRLSRPVQNVKHGRLTGSIVGMLNRMHHVQSLNVGLHERNLQPVDKEAGQAQAETRATFFADALRIRKASSSQTESTHLHRHFKAVGSAPLNQTTAPEVSSDAARSDDEVANSAINGLADDPDNAALRITSPTLSPPLMANSKRPFYISPHESASEASNAGEDFPEFPEFDALVGRPQRKTPALSEELESRSTYMDKRPRARGRRRIIENESDEE